MRRKWWLKVREPEMEDLMQAGCVGLMRAASRWSPERGATFRTYAHQRVIGAAIDQIRSQVYGRLGREKLVLVPVLECDAPLSEGEEPLTATVEKSDDGESDESLLDKVAQVRKSAMVRLQLDLMMTRRDAEMAVKYVMEGKAMRLIGVDFDLSEARVSQVLGRGRLARIIEVIEDVARRLA